MPELSAHCNAGQFANLASKMRVWDVVVITGEVRKMAQSFLRHHPCGYRHFFGYKRRLLPSYHLPRCIFLLVRMMVTLYAESKLIIPRKLTFTFRLEAKPQRTASPTNRLWLVACRGFYFHSGTDRVLRQGPWKLVSAKLDQWELYNWGRIEQIPKI